MAFRFPHQIYTLCLYKLTHSDITQPHVLQLPLKPSIMSSFGKQVFFLSKELSSQSLRWINNMSAVTWLLSSSCLSKYALSDFRYLSAFPSAVMQQKSCSFFIMMINTTIHLLQFEFLSSILALPKKHPCCTEWAPVTHQGEVSPESTHGSTDKIKKGGL